MSKPEIRAIAETDRPAVLALNQGAVPHVGPLTLNNLRTLIGQTCYARMVVVEQELAGFMLAWHPGNPIKAPTIAGFASAMKASCTWTVSQWPSFSGPGHRQSAVSGSRAAAGRATRITCEVNLPPPNPGSMAFHQKLGFVEVGQQDIDGGSKRVSLLCKDLSAVG